MKKSAAAALMLVTEEQPVLQPVLSPALVDSSSCSPSVDGRPSGEQDRTIATHEKPKDGQEDEDAKDEDAMDEEDAKDEDAMDEDAMDEEDAKDEEEGMRSWKAGTYEVEKIVDVQRSPSDPSDIKYLIKWKGWASKYNTWEPIEHLHNLQAEITSFEVSRASQA